VWQHLGAGSDELWTPEVISEIEKCARKGAADPGRMHPDEVTEKPRATWQDLARARGIPEEYWPTADLKPFCRESKPDWWDFLWPRVQKAIDATKWPPLSQPDYTTGGVKSRKRYCSDFENTCRGHLATLARLRDSGILQGQTPVM